MLFPPIYQVDSYLLIYLLLSERSVAKPKLFFSQAPSRKRVPLIMGQANSPEPSSLVSSGLALTWQRCGAPQMTCPGGGVLALWPGFQETTEPLLHSGSEGCVLGV